MFRFGRVSVVVGFAVTVVLLAACGSKPAAPAAPAASAPAPAPAQPPAEAAKPAAAPPQKAAAAPQPAAPVSPPAAKKPPLVVKVAYPGEPETKDYPSVLAWRSLPKDLYDVQIKPAARMALATQAVMTGEVDVASAGVNLAMNGILQGGTVKAIAENVGISWRLIVAENIRSVPDLDGKSVGRGSAGGVPAILFNTTVEKYKIKPTFITMNQSADSVQALINGQISAMLGTVEDLNFAQEKKPGVHALIEYAKEVPIMGGTYFFAHGDFLAKQPAAVRDMMEALVKSYRRFIDDPAYALAELKQAFREQGEDRLKKTLQDSYNVRLWHPNLHMDKDTLEFSAEQYFQNKAIPERLTLSKWAAPEFADSALAKLGRR